MMFGLPPSAAGQGGAQGRASGNDRMLVGFAVTWCDGEMHMDLDDAVQYRLDFALAGQFREADSQNHAGRTRQPRSATRSGR
jgi:hypothetical protein